MASKTGYMDKEVTESARVHKEGEKRNKEYTDWLKDARERSRQYHKRFQGDMNKLSAETRDRHKEYVKKNREYSKTLGKYK